MDRCRVHERHVAHEEVCDTRTEGRLTAEVDDLPLDHVDEHALIHGKLAAVRYVLQTTRHGKRGPGGTLITTSHTAIHNLNITIIIPPIGHLPFFFIAHTTCCGSDGYRPFVEVLNAPPCTIVCAECRC